MRHTIYMLIDEITVLIEGAFPVLASMLNIECMKLKR